MSVENRRQVRGLVLCACTFVLAGSVYWAAPKELAGKQTINPSPKAAQTNGPLVGAVTEMSAKIFVRTTLPATVCIETATAPDQWPGVRSGCGRTAEASDYTTIVPVTELTADTKYYYRILVDSVPQQTEAPYPSFKTFPPPGTFRDFKFIVISDTEHVNDGHDAPVYAKVEEEDPAFVIQIGDFDHSIPLTLAQMREQNRNVRDGDSVSGQAFRQHIAPRFPFFHVWDDHDYGPNDSDKTFAGRAESIQAFQEYYPVPDLPNPAGIWHKFRYGQCEFFMLDLRSQRDPNSTPDDVNKSMLDGDNIPNGQKQWLKDSLVASNATWKFILTSVPMNRTSKRIPKDAWSGFLTERAELLAFISDIGIGGVVFISGDLHSGGGIDNGSHSGRVELNVPHTNMPTGDSGELGSWTEGMFSGDNGAAGYGRIQVSTLPNKLVIEAVGVDGTTRVSYTIGGI